MASNILAVFCALVAILAGIFVVWAEIGPDKKKDKKETEDKNDPE